ncbi:MAG: plasmid recombination protein [Spirochaetales bacterium]|nr:plasmid recombination protein [Spirochaetales bacterium]
MSYLVARMQKNNTQNLGGMQKHNQREFENHSNKDIDKEQSYLNYDLVNEGNINYREKIMSTIDTQREITKSTKAIRKDAVLVNEFIVTSDKGFFNNLSDVDQQLFFKTATDWFQERYGEQNVVFATVHNDEITPHMHLGVVPMRDGKLQGKNVFNRKELLYIQDDLPKFLGKRGFDIERGKEGSETVHADFNDWKREQARAREDVFELRREATRLAPEVENLSSERVSLKQEVKILKQEKSGLKDENERFKESLTYLDDKPIEKWGLKDNNFVAIKREDYNKLAEIKHNSKVLKKENEGLSGQVEKLKLDKEELQDRNSFLELSMDELKQTLKTARRHMKDLKENGNVLWDRCMSFAHKFRSNKDVARENEDGIEDMFSDQVGIMDYEEWSKNNIRVHSFNKQR